MITVSAGRPLWCRFPTAGLRHGRPWLPLRLFVRVCRLWTVPSMSRVRFEFGAERIAGGWQWGLCCLRRSRVVRGRLELRRHAAAEHNSDERVHEGEIKAIHSVVDVV
jgi:hypothetical protein